ncbi:MAG: AMP-binding protein [Halobacteriota archaeon]
MVVPGTVMLKSSDIEYRIMDAGISALITYDTSVAEEVDAIKEHLPEIKLFFSGKRERWKNYEFEMNSTSKNLDIETLHADDLLAINYTCGTTGALKGVLHTHSLMYCFDRLNRYYWLSYDGRQPDPVGQNGIGDRTIRCGVKCRSW